MFDYAGDRVQRTVQPGAITHDPLTFAQTVHAACRRLGLDVDVVPPAADLGGYRAILLPTSTIDDTGLVARLVAARDAGAAIVMFPRTGSRDAEFRIPDALPPGAFRRLIDVRVVRAETLPAFERPVARRSVSTMKAVIDADPASIAVGPEGPAFPASTTTHAWREHVESSLEPQARFEDGWGFHYADGRVHYVNAIPERDALRALLAPILETAGVPVHDLGAGLRLRRLGAVTFAFNVGPDTADLDARLPAGAGLGADTELLFGSRVLRPAELAAWADAGFAG